MEAQEIKFYVDCINEYYYKNKRTSEIQIDTLIIVFKMTRDERIFNLLFITHKFLLLSLVQQKFNQYRRFLYDEDFYDILSMAYGEFFRLVMFYKIPPEAPFSKYIKLYMKKWLNSYVKLIVKKNNRTILNTDYKNQDNDDEYQ